jgi:hypothetical protein
MMYDHVLKHGESYNQIKIFLAFNHKKCTFSHPVHTWWFERFRDFVTLSDLHEKHISYRLHITFIMKFQS